MSVEKLNVLLEEKIAIPQRLVDLAHERVEEIKDVLRNIAGIEYFTFQGSFARKTAIKPRGKNGEFDIDMVAIHSVDSFDPNSEEDLSKFHHYSEEIYNHLYPHFKGISTFGEKPTKANQIQFSKQFHIDVIPLIIDKYGNEWIYDVVKHKAFISNPLKLVGAFNKRATSVLRNVIKLIKHFKHELVDSDPLFVGIQSVALEIYMLDCVNKGFGDEVLLNYLKQFMNMPTRIQNPFVEEEIFEIDLYSLNLVKGRVEEWIIKLEKEAGKE